jgi:urease accessory protein
MATVYIQCCSGGLFENDAVRARIDCGKGAKAHLTTSAATVVHSMEVGEATQAVEIVIGAGGLMEYLPDPTILFPGARLDNRVRVHLSERAVALMWDTVLTHDPAANTGGANSPGVSNLCRQRLRNEIIVQSSSGDLLACDRWVAGGDAGTRLVPGVLGPYRCQASFLVLGQGLQISELVDLIRAGLDQQPGVFAGASSLPNDCGVIVRLLSADAADVRAGLHAAWNCARRLLLGAEAIARRK